MAVSESDTAFWAYLDDLHAWVMQHFSVLWDRIDPDDFEGSYSQVYRGFRELHYRSVAAALYASDDYVLAQAAGAGWWVSPDWREAEDWWARPSQLRNKTVSAEQMLRIVPSVMKAQVGAGLGPVKAMKVGQARVARILGTEPSAVSRNYTREFVAREGGPEVRRLSSADYQVRRNRVSGPKRQPVQSSLELPQVGRGGRDAPFRFWRRVPRPGACDFCLMLATRGAVYSSREVALGRDGRKYHDFCRCRVQLVTNPAQQREVIVGADDAKRQIKFRAQTGDTYQYDVGTFNVVPPKPEWTR